jgi:serine/threonine protein kinase/tetratricopeptide (TPR) repeat protein
MTTQAEHEHSSGEILSHYKIVSLLGKGGMGIVYLADDLILHRKVALKLLPVHFADKLRLRRFEQEAFAASALNHPNILTIHEIGESDGARFIVSEYITGKTLREKISGLTVSESLDIAVQVSSALDAAHQRGIVHRDIKPENIMIRDDGLVKVLDFGLAKLSEKHLLAPDKSAKTLSLIETSPGMIMGTANYMSPEQARGKEIDARSDIFSFGIVLYEMMAGRLPFQGETAVDVLAAILNLEPSPLSTEARSTGLQEIIATALQKDPRNRFQTSGELLADLKSVKKRRDTEFHLMHASSPERGEKAQTAETRVLSTSTAGRSFQLKPARRVFVAIVFILFIVASSIVVYQTRGGWLGNNIASPSQPEIRSLAILPLRSLDSNENYLGLGVADAIIRRIDQTGQLIVRPTSAVRPYLNDDVDALTAARQLNADAVLEGSVQHANDRLRVSVNLLRTSDGASLWAESFDLRMTDIFTLQDTVSQQIAERLRLRLDPSHQALLVKRYTSNPIAYEFYVKGVYSFDRRVVTDRAAMKVTIDLFRKAVDADADFSLAHAQLAYAYAVMATFVEPTDPKWAGLTQQEIRRAEYLDPALAETHLARSLMLWSAYEGFQTDAAIRELLSAQQLNPNVGHAELAALYGHVGLEDLAVRELARATEIDPTSEFVKTQTLIHYWLDAKYDEWFAAEQRLYGGTDNDVGSSAWYLLGKGQLDEAQKQIDKLSMRTPADPLLPSRKGVLYALKGDFRSAEAEIPAILDKRSIWDPSYHHAAYDIACIFALEGKNDEAVKWLRKTAETGFPDYALFKRDHYLDHIRQAPEFVQFMSEMKAQSERYLDEFGGSHL